MNFVTQMNFGIISLVAILVSCGANNVSSSQEQNATTLDNNIPNIGVPIASFYEDCIITRAFDTPNNISDAKMKCIAPTFEYCEDRLRDEGIGRDRITNACSIMVYDAIEWILEEGNAIECDSGSCSVIKR